MAGWPATLEALSRRLERQVPAEVFAAAVARGDVDSLLVRDAAGELVYPDAALSFVPSTEAEDPAWQRAERLESQAEWFAAAEAYAEFAAAASDPLSQGRAWQAQVRCLLSAGEQAAAIEVLEELTRQDAVVDADGRSPAAAAELRLLELLDRDSDAWQRGGGEAHPRGWGIIRRRHRCWRRSDGF